MSNNNADQRNNDSQVERLLNFKNRFPYKKNTISLSKSALKITLGRPEPKQKKSQRSESPGDMKGQLKED